MDNKPKITPKDFFLWAGAIVAFYWSIIAYGGLVFNYIDYVFPNALDYYPSDPYEGGISYQMASLIVLFPVYLFLANLIRRDIARDASRAEVWVRRWAIILTLFVAGAAIAADLITLLTTFLNGEELTAAFLLKIAVVLLLAVGVFMHFISDLRGYWERFPSRKRVVVWSVAALVIATIIAGFFVVGTPRDARLARFDTERVNSLQSIQWSVVNYYEAKQKLPAKIEDLEDSLSYSTLPTDPETDKPYVYEATGALSFKLCADFSIKSRPGYSGYYYDEPMGVMSMGAPTNLKDDNWQHDAGTVCFERTIDPAFYPPLKN